MSEFQKKIDQTYSEVRYSHINWSIHLLPTAKQAAQEFAEEMQAQELPPVQLSVASEEQEAQGTKRPDVWADKIVFFYDARPVTVPDVVPSSDGIANLVENQARLELSQALSGAITAEVFLPSSPIAKPVKSSYVLNTWENPGCIGKGELIQLLRLMTEVNHYCGSINYPNAKGYRLLAKLEAKDAILTQGKSRFWTWFNYYTRTSKGGARFYTHELSQAS